MSDRFDHAASFGAIAADYSRSRPAWPSVMFQWLAEQAPSRALAVDVGAGGGQASLALAEHFTRVIAVDPSEDLLRTIPARPGLETRAQRAEDLHLDERADILTACQSVHWYAGDPFWARVRAALHAGGVLAIAGYSWFTVDDRVDERIRDRLLPALDPHWSPRNRLVIDGYRGLAVPFAEFATPDFEIRLTWTLGQLLAYLGTWSAATALRSTGRDAVADVAPLLREVWAEDEPRPVRMPIALRAFRA